MADLKEIRVPDIGDFDNVEIIEVLVSEGDTIEPEDSLLSLESDKATMEVPAPEGGVVKELKVKVGDRVSEGDVVLMLEPAGDAAGEEEPEQRSDDEGEASEDTAPEESPQEADEADPADEDEGSKKAGESRESSTEAGSGDDRGPSSPPVPFDASQVRPEEVPHASPSVRRFARELGVELAEVKGSGRKGRILKDDVQEFVKGVMQRKGAGVPQAGAPVGGLQLLDWPKVDFSKFGPVQIEPLSRIKKISGANLARNWVMIPHVTQHDEADITELEAFRKAQSEEAKKKGIKLTPLAFLMKAAVAALKEYPQFNASLDETGENLVLKEYFHIGVAVDTPDGLVVPVIRDCDRKSLYDLAEELGEVSARARDRKLGPDDMQGGCFSISSLGGIGGTYFTPIVNAPEVSILGVSRSAMKPVWNGEAFEPRLMLPLSLSYDHRVIDGASAARFTSYLGHVLSDIRRLLL